MTDQNMTIEELLTDYDNGIIHVVESGKLKEGEYELTDEDQ